MKKDEEFDNIRSPLIQPIRRSSSMGSQLSRVSEIDFVTRAKKFMHLQKGSISGSVVCLLCLTFGSGLLTLPYSFVKVGIGLGLILFFVASFCSYWTTNLLFKIAIHQEYIDYSGLVGKFFGQNQLYFYELVNLLNNFGSIIVYQQIISNFTLTICQDFGLTFILEYPRASRFIQMYSFCIFFLIPLTFAKNIEKLQNFALYGTIALMYTVVVSVIEFPFYFMQNFTWERVKVYDFNFNVVKVMCMYFFSFANHNAMLNVMSETDDPHDKKNNKKIIIAQFNILFWTYLTVMITGYLSTFEMTKEIFIDREGESFFMVIGKVCYNVSLICHIGLYYYISKPSIENLVVGSELDEGQNYACGSISMLILCTIAYYFTSISDVISLIGATCDIYLIFIMPVLLYLAYKPKRDWRRYLSIGILVFAIIISLAHLSFSFTDVFVGNLLDTQP